MPVQPSCQKVKLSSRLMVIFIKHRLQFTLVYIQFTKKYLFLMYIKENETEKAIGFSG